jgi:lipid-A-disaccharide synthase
VKVLVSCGEPSGDLYAGALTRELLALEPHTEVFGLGGEALRAAGGTLVGDFHRLAVTGIVEVLSVLPRALQMHRQLVARARAERPDVCVVIDFPDFNFRLAASMRALGVPVVYYVSPQLWAWRPARMKKMRRLVSQVLVIFPFEAPLYEAAGVPVEFVGHPLLDLASVSAPREVFLRECGLDPAAPVVGLLPGSRRNEVASILPVLADAARLITAQVPAAQFLIARAPGLDSALFESVLASSRVRLASVAQRADDVLASSDVVITASGTATVQAAIHERPMVIVYRLSSLTYALGKPFVKVDTYGMVNLVAGEKVVPELIQDDFTAERVAIETLAYLTNPEHVRVTRQRLRDVCRRLGEPGASRRAAAAVLRVAKAHAVSMGAQR